MPYNKTRKSNWFEFVNLSNQDNKTNQLRLDKNNITMLIVTNLIFAQ